MSGTKKFPWLSSCLLILTYGVFGWVVAQSSLVWSEGIVAQGRALGWIIDDKSVHIVIDLLGAVLILLIAIAFTAPIALATIFFGSWLKSETRAWISILGWAFAVVFIIRWINYFARILVLVCAALLGRLEFQAAGYNSWQTFIILTLICLGGFTSGVLAFMQLGR
ncbi:hypothetical protein NIES593_20980 [Hydrococcus rivularis NIES-593]|uniref:Uncharacterized protein n=1 Tax=Hydrococcus rivularis NIES-593 TaxID=1921803 RepID=A0A1U7H8G9_9CYAN|nr:hypothetical protein [Hydrococcus rivularis]OKH19473.1 hypothetical protein NIES593_20980 [Hydrococcus rivularis NIES-593]